MLKSSRKTLGQSTDIVALENAKRKKDALTSKCNDTERSGSVGTGMLHLPYR